MSQLRPTAPGRRRSLVGAAAISVLALLVALGATAAFGSRSAKTTSAAPTVLHTAAADCTSVKRGGTLTYGVDQDVISIDAANTQDNGSLWADMNVYDQL